jgi:hypothetical protein
MLELNPNKSALIIILQHYKLLETEFTEIRDNELAKQAENRLYPILVALTNLARNEKNSEKLCMLLSYFSGCNRLAPDMYFGTLEELANHDSAQVLRRVLSKLRDYINAYNGDSAHDVASRAEKIIQTISERVQETNKQNAVVQLKLCTTVLKLKRSTSGDDDLQPIYDDIIKYNLVEALAFKYARKISKKNVKCEALLAKYGLEHGILEIPSSVPLSALVNNCSSHVLAGDRYSSILLEFVEKFYQIHSVSVGAQFLTDVYSQVYNINHYYKGDKPLQVRMLNTSLKILTISNYRCIHSRNMLSLSTKLLRDVAQDLVSGMKTGFQIPFCTLYAILEFLESSGKAAALEVDVMSSIYIKNIAEQLCNVSNLHMVQKALEIVLLVVSFKVTRFLCKRWISDAIINNVSSRFKDKAEIQEMLAKLRFKLGRAIPIVHNFTDISVKYC